MGAEDLRGNPVLGTEGVGGQERGVDRPVIDGAGALRVRFGASVGDWYVVRPPGPVGHGGAARRWVGRFSRQPDAGSPEWGYRNRARYGGLGHVLDAFWDRVCSGFNRQTGPPGNRPS
jgi:hypothetical protein